MNIIKESNLSSWGTDSSGKKWEDYDTIVCPNGQVIDMVKLLEDQQRAKAALVHLLPAFGGLVSKLKFIYTFKISTQATDGYYLLVNPQFTYNLDLTGKVFVMAHEVMHCVLQHMRRGKGHDREKSNIAADYEVNSTLASLDLIRGETILKMGGLYDKKYDNWGYEKIYNDNPQANSQQSMNNKQQQQQAQQNQQGQQGQGGSNQETYSEEYKKGWAQAIADYKSGKLKI